MWGQSRKRKQKYATGLIPPGLQCEHRCQHFPCVAVTVGAAEEAEAWPGSAWLRRGPDRRGCRREGPVG
eukprot:3537337-Prymnesium_polylepis.1